MNVVFPPVVRQVIYVIIVLGTAIVIPLHQFEVVSDLLLTLWSSVSGAAALLASLNVNKQ